jgi:hypothetical protein
MTQNNKFIRQKRLMENRKHKKRMLTKYTHLRPINKVHYRKGINETRKKHVKKRIWREEKHIKAA